MPRRYGKVTRFVLRNLYLRDAYSVAGLATSERKAIRQMQPKLLSKTTPRPVPALTPGQIAFHGGLTANREHFTLAAIQAAKACKGTKASIDDL
jgi:hypothetical protein